MFRDLAAQITADRVLTAHPQQLSRFLDQAWAEASRGPVLGVPGFEFPPPGVIDAYSPPGLTDEFHPGIDPANAFNFNLRARRQVLNVPTLWSHLFYAYAIESTGVFEILTEVVRRTVAGESLPVNTIVARQWARTTEELFHRDPPPFTIGSLLSDLRPDGRVNRSNAYWRMFALELPHRPSVRWAPSAILGPQPWKADTQPGVNQTFLEKFEELLRQIWVGLQNGANTSGANPTDPSYISLLCESLRDMLVMRRRFGLLAREEYVYVSVMSWYHLTVENNNSPIVVALNAQASDPAERLRRIGAMVGMQPAERSRELFELADLVAAFLRLIEVNTFPNAGAAAVLFTALATNPLAQSLNRIIDLWQSSTGHPLKETRVATMATPMATQPLRVPAPSAALASITPTASANGSR